MVPRFCDGINGGDILNLGHDYGVSGICSVVRRNATFEVDGCRAGTRARRTERLQCRAVDGVLYMALWRRLGG